MAKAERKEPRAVPEQGLDYKPPPGYSLNLTEIFNNENAKELCSRCQTTQKGLQNWKWGNQRPEAKMNSEDFLLESLATSSCAVCSILYGGFKKFHEESGLLATRFQFMYSYNRFRLQQVRDRPEFDGVAELEYYCTADQPCPWGIFPTLLDTMSNTGSEERLAKAVEWIEECKQHAACKDNNGPKKLPTRVLDVGGGKVRLLEVKSQTARYIALSHCWGKHRPLTTISRTLYSHLRDIPWASIPKTFQDSIEIVRRLGIQYIWIDSLCIIQDDKEDWTRESGLMYGVYSNAYLTISASSAPDSRYGLFRDTKTVKLSGKTKGGYPYSVIIRPKMKHPKPWNLEKTKQYFPIFERGWVFQEQILSARTLHFGHAELLWECREKLDCECLAVYFFNRGFQKKKGT